MNKLILNVKGQKLTREDSVKPVMNTDGLIVKVNFNDDNWNELDKELLIIYNNEGVLRLNLNEEDEVAIPKECLLVNKIILAVEGSSVNFPCVPTTSLTVELDNSIHQAGYNELDLTGLIINQLNNAIASTGHTINYENTWLKLKDASGNEISQVQILGGGGEAALVEMTANLEGIYWRYQGELNWNLLIAKSDLIGPKGDPGLDGDPGLNGDPGVGIVSVTKISTVDLTDTYRILLTNGTHYDFSSQ